jgi:CheY-like chemotaxis protein
LYFLIKDCRRSLRLSTDTLLTEDDTVGSRSDDLIDAQWAAFSYYTQPRARLSTSEGPLELKLKSSIESNHLEFSKRLSLMEQHTKLVLESETARLRANSEAKISETRRLFLRSIMNDVRSPLAVLDMCVRRLQDQQLPEGDAAFMGFTCQAMADVLTNYALYEDAESGQELALHRRLTSVRTLVWAAAAPFAVLAKESGVTLSVQLEKDAELFVNVDVDRVQHALRSLLADAFKYSPVRSTIEVTVGSLIEEGLNFAVVSINNEGRETLVRGGSTDLRVLEGRQGSGLGAHVVRRMLALHGGRLIADSEQQGGHLRNVFTVLLPAAAPRVDAPVQEAPVAVTRRPLRVLVVDDAMLVRKMTQRSILTLLPTAEVSEASDGREAVEAVLLAGAHPPDLILMDCSMPVMTGVEATRLIRAGGFKGGVVIVTGNALAADLLECRGCGTDDVFLKPLSAEALRSILDSQAQRLEMPRAHDV